MWTDEKALNIFGMTVDVAIFETICKNYAYFTKEDVLSWSLEEAQKLVDFEIQRDIEAGIEPLPYDAEDFYDTIKNLIKQDIEEKNDWFEWAVE